MYQVTCFIGRLRAGSDIDFPLTLDGGSIPEYFHYGSMDSQGQPGIHMRMDDSRYDDAIIPAGRPTTAYYLQNALARLVNNPTHVRRVERIGLVLADRFRPRPGLLGLMFDYGFNPQGMDPVDEVFTGVPREGCAIFLNAIRDIRATLGDYRREVVFTAIHELGHVFNLWHLNSPMSFMSSSQREAPFPPSAYKFHGSQRNFLHRANEDPFVTPGGSKFDSRGASGPPANDPFASPTLSKNLQLTISVSQDEFWYFEPIELDVILTAKKETKLPDEVDPGYENFVIHITRPDGTKFKFRSPRIYCRNASMITVGPRQPFVRDISLFGQSGGYTFQSPGEYKVQCAFTAGPVHLVSNPISVLVKKPMIHNVKFQHLQEALTRKSSALLLYHRNGNFRKQTVDHLQEIAKGNRRNKLGVNIMYALAKFATQNNTVSLQNRRFATQLSQRALDSGKLGVAREKNLKVLQAACAS